MIIQLSKSEAIDLALGWIAMEAITDGDTPLGTPRTPKFKGTEDIPWSNVNKTFNGFVEAYYDRTGKAKPEKLPTSFSECSDDMKQWISAHSILGNPESKGFGAAIVLPVVNPMTGKLNKHAVSSATAYANRVKGVDAATIKKTKELLSKLYAKHFPAEPEKEKK